uniref:Complement receptor 2 n=1 Tax=Mus musculus TaxID=10090 RepID=Q32M14_MOUSE|nr:Cr2 protein [Mus musculus]
MGSLGSLWVFFTLITPGVLDQDVELSATSSAPYLLTCHQATLHDNNGLNL